MELPDYNKVTKWSIQDVINWLSVFKLSSSCVRKLREEGVDGHTLLNLTVQQLFRWNVDQTDLRTILDFVGRIQGTSSVIENDHADHRCSYNSLDAGSDSDWSEGSWSDPDFETEEINETAANTVPCHNDNSFNTWTKPPELNTSFSTLKKPPKPLPSLPSPTVQEGHYDQPDQRNSRLNALQTFSSEMLNSKSNPAPPPVRPSKDDGNSQTLFSQLSIKLGQQRGPRQRQDIHRANTLPRAPRATRQDVMDEDYEKVDTRSTPPVQTHSKPNVLQTPPSKHVVKSYRGLPALPGQEEDYVQMDANNPPPVQRKSKLNAMQTAPSQRFINSPSARLAKPFGEQEYEQMDAKLPLPVQRNFKPNVVQTSPPQRVVNSNPALTRKPPWEDDYETPQQPVQIYSKPSLLQRSATFSPATNSRNVKPKPACPPKPSQQQQHSYHTSQNVKGHTWARRNTTRPLPSTPTPQNHDGLYLIRKGTTTPDRPFSVIVYVQGRVYNLPIFINSSNNYIVGKKSKKDFTNVVALVNFYKKNPIEIQDRTKGAIQVKLKSSANKPK